MDKGKILGTNLRIIYKCHGNGCRCRWNSGILAERRYPFQNGAYSKLFLQRIKVNVLGVNKQAVWPYR